jgi:hypothetical protein
VDEIVVSDFWDVDGWVAGAVFCWIFAGGGIFRVGMRVEETRERVNRERLITAIGSNDGRFDFHTRQSYIVRSSLILFPMF